MQPSGGKDRLEPAKGAGDSTGWMREAAAPADASLEAIRERSRYEDFLRSAVDWIWETDARLAFVYVSRPVVQKLGIPAQSLIGRSLFDLGRFAPARDTESDGRAAIEARRPFRDAIFVVTDREERALRFRLSGMPAFDDSSGRFAGFRGTAVAESPRAPGQAASAASEEELKALARTLEETLLRHQELSWQLSNMKSQRTASPFLARTAHELRTPLNAVIGYADLALGEFFGPLNERYMDCFRTIREAGRYLNQLVGQLGEVGAPDRLHSEIVEVSAIVAKAKAMVALDAKNREVDISRVGSLAGGRVIGDRVACTQILVNLLNNAIKFTRPGGAVGLETLAGADEQLQIVVWDTGIGIPQDEQGRIFDPQYRAKGAGDTEVPGLGLGLAIARDLARAMGGDVTVASQPGQGSRFVLSLPLAGSPPASPPVPGAA